MLLALIKLTVYREEGRYYINLLIVIIFPQHIPYNTL